MSYFIGPLTLKHSDCKSAIGLSMLLIPPPVFTGGDYRLALRLSVGLSTEIWIPR